MSDYTIKHLDDMDEHHDDGFKMIRRELGITAFGINMTTSPPNHDDYPEHDHLDDGQEEVYIVLEGDSTVTIDGEPHAVRKGHVIRVGPGSRRKLSAGPGGMQVLTIGGVPPEGFTPNW